MGGLHFYPGEGGIVPVTEVVETGALGRRPGHPGRRVEEGFVKGGTAGNPGSRLETGAPGKPHRNTQVGADREPLPCRIVGDGEEAQAVGVDTAQDAEVFGLCQTRRAADFPGPGRGQEDPFDLLEPGLEHLELDAGAGRSSDQVGGERKLDPCRGNQPGRQIGKGQLVGESPADFGCRQVTGLPDIETQPQD